MLKAKKEVNMKVVLVEWIDACYYQGERNINWIKETAKPRKVISSGFLIEKDNEKIIICQEISLEDKEVSGNLVIPLQMVTKIGFLERGKTNET